MDLVLIDIENRIRELKVELKQLERIRRSKDVKLYLDYRERYNRGSKEV